MSTRRVACLARALRLAALLASLFAVPATAETVPAGDPLERARRALERAMANPAPEHEAEAEQRALSALKQQLVTVAASILRLEAQLGGAEEAISRLEIEEHAATNVLAERRGDVSRLMSALQRLARRPEVPFPVGSGDANDILHGRILLEAAKPRARTGGARPGVESAPTRFAPERNRGSERPPRPGGPKAR